MSSFKHYAPSSHLAWQGNKLPDIVPLRHMVYMNFATLHADTYKVVDLLNEHAGGKNLMIYLL